MNKISDILNKVRKKKSHQDSITLGDIKESLHDKGFYILMIIFALPLCIPIPVPPGYTTIFSIPLILFSLQLTLGIDSPWIPSFIAKAKIKRSIIVGIVKKSNPWIIKIENATKFNRLPFLASNKVFGYISAFFCLIFAISISLPLPMTNFIPAIGIVFISIGKITKDGAFVAMGIIIGTIGLWITLLIITFGVEVIQKIINLSSKRGQ